MLLLPATSLLLFLSTLKLTTASPAPAPTSLSTPENTDEECTVTSPFSESFFDLRPLRRVPDHDPPHHDWTVKGQDYGANFTINICGPVLSKAAGKVDGLGKEGVGKNVSALYEKEGEVFSIGAVSTIPRFRGRKLVLAYENGSPCPHAPELRKSSLFSLMCDHEAYSKPSVSFVGQFNDCSYFFELRTSKACPKVKAAETIAPVAVFTIIMAVALVAYCLGGCFYQRTVMHARGWRQIPHFAAWAGVVGFFWNATNTTWTSIIERLPLPSSVRLRSNSGGFGARTVGGDRLFGDGRRRNSVEDENRLIDELDDEWA